MISCILLTAGSSVRFGSPKALAIINPGETVIEHTIKILQKSSISETIVVLGAHADQIKPSLLKHKSIKPVYNKDHNFGQTSSFKAGLRNICEKSSGVMLLPIDYAFVQLEAINNMVEHFDKYKPSILVPTFNGRKGHPPIFEILLKSEFLDLPDNKGINTIAQKMADKVECLEVSDSGVVESFNTKQEFDRLIEKRQRLP